MAITLPLNYARSPHAKKEILFNLKLDGLKCSRIKGDLGLIMRYKILNGLFDTSIARAVGYTLIFTCGNSLRLSKCTIATERKNNFFTYRIVNIWSSWSDSIILASSDSNFKRTFRLLSVSHVLLLTWRAI